MFKHLFLLFFILISSPVWSCENSLSIKENIIQDICSNKDIFVSSKIQATENLKIEVHGKIFGMINNTKNIVLKTYLPENLKAFSNPSKVTLILIKTNSFKFKHAISQAVTYSGAFIGLVLLTYLFLYKTPWFYKIRIIKDDISNKQIIREILVGSTGVFITFLVIFYNESFLEWIPFNKLFNDSSTSWVYHVFSFLLLMVLYDTFFFWLHYSFHKSKFLYKIMHVLHHLSKNPNPLTALNFNPLEMIGNYGLLIVCSMIFPVHIEVFKYFFIFHTIFDIYKHCGHQIIPIKFDRWLSEYFLIGPNYHEIHHTQPKYHMGFYFPYWDKIMKVYNPQWEKEITNE